MPTSDCWWCACASVRLRVCVSGEKGSLFPMCGGMAGLLCSLGRCGGCLLGVGFMLVGCWVVSYLGEGLLRLKIAKVLCRCVLWVSVSIVPVKKSVNQGRVNLGVNGAEVPECMCLQVVGVKGLNPTGTIFVARQLCLGVPAPRLASPSAPTPLGPSPSSAPCEGMSLVLACGPYTANGDMAFEPLEELLRCCSGRRGQEE